MKIEKMNANNVGETTSRQLYEGISQDRGITLVSLIITVIILLILSGVTINNLSNSSNVAPYNNMIADIKLLEDKISIYYNKYAEIPIIEKSNQEIDGVEYYKIDVSKLDNVTLNYGTEDKGDKTDIYLVNNNLEVYYLRGVEKSETIHHTRND